MCFSPQRRAFFQHQNVQKWSKHVMFCTFWLQNVLFATAACIFSTSERTKVVQTRHVLYILTSKCAFRHSGVQFLMSPLSTYLRTRRFNRPTFRLTRHTNHWKNTAFRDFSNIWRGCIFFHLTFAPLHLLSTDLTTLYTAVLFICFSTLHIVGSFYLNFLRQMIFFPCILAGACLECLQVHFQQGFSTNITQSWVVTDPTFLPTCPQICQAGCKGPWECAHGKTIWWLHRDRRLQDFTWWETNI